MFDFTIRTALLLGEPVMERLASSTVAVIGLGGVGGAIAEALCRSGVGHLVLCDHDNVELSNINRQLFATKSTVGIQKVNAAAERILSINPNIKLSLLPVFYGADTAEMLFSLNPSYIADAIDTVTAKLHLAVACRERRIPLISSLGTGNRLDPTSFRIGTIAQTAGCGCGLARVMRRELKARGILDQEVLYSTEQPMQVISSSEHGRHSPASISFCPPVAGYIIASHIVKRLAESV